MKPLVAMSRGAMPADLSVAMILPMAALLAASASCAVSACDTVPVVTMAMSGGAVTVPVPDMEISAVCSVASWARAGIVAMATRASNSATHPARNAIFNCMGTPLQVFVIGGHRVFVVGAGAGPAGAQIASDWVLIAAARCATPRAYA